MSLRIPSEVHAELQYLVQLIAQHGAPYPIESIEGIASWVLTSIADGSRRPGAWERQLLEMLGIVPDCDELAFYRAEYGRPQE